MRHDPPSVLWLRGRGVPAADRRRAGGGGMSAVEAPADWCASDGNFAICGTRMKEHSRRSEGIKWCFHCRKRHEFWWVVSVPDGLSYYGPSAGMEGIGDWCTDLFPGWYREGIDA